jgi:hypothetical protein
MCFSHRIGVYLEKYFKWYNIDCEYSKMWRDPKRCNDKVIRPDIIIHKRLIQTDNIVIFEVKLAWRNSKKWKADIEKLKSEITCLKYSFWVFIWILKREIHLVFIDSELKEKDITL